MIICAAIYIETEDKDLVVYGRRHSDCFETKSQLAEKWKNGKVTQGFIDHAGAFYDRETAYVYATYCGQISATVREHKNERGEYKLYSEDLY